MIKKVTTHKKIICIVIALALLFGLTSPSLSYAKAGLNSIGNKEAQDGPVVSTQINDEGIVMLKNKNNALPLTENWNVNLFGVGSANQGWYYQGNGSGRGSQSNQQSLYQAFRNNGFRINETLANDYNNCRVSNRVDCVEKPDVNYRINETSSKFVTDRIPEALKFSNQAIYVISRYGGEGNDLPKFQYKNTEGKIGWDKDRHYLQLTTDEEESLVALTNTKGIDSVYVVFNCCNPMECRWLEPATNNTKINSDIIKGAFYMPMGGNTGPNTVPKVFNGSVNPSGHLTDTIPVDFKTDPTYANISYEYCGENSFADDTRYRDCRFMDRPDDYLQYTCYEENIYQGYYWYETAYREGFFGAADYNQVVMYPFGYGLSYTKFDWVLKNVTVTTDPQSKSKNDKVLKFEVQVTNNGLVAGKDVVELYVEKPYYPGRIEKPYTQLCSFVKSSELEANTSETLFMQIHLQDIADYDCYDKNNDYLKDKSTNGSGYKLDAGDYLFKLQRDSHNAVDKCEYKYTIDNLLLFPNDRVTGTTITNLFTNYTNHATGVTYTNTDHHSINMRCGSIDGSDLNKTGIGAKYLTRANKFADFPKTYLPKPTLGADHEATRIVGEPWVEKDKEDSKPPQQDQPVKYKLKDMANASYDSDKWDSLMDSLSIQEMADEVRAVGGFGSPAISKIDKPKTEEKDGPCGYSGPIGSSSYKATNFPSDSMVGSTWNYQLSYEFGKALGNEGVNKLGGIDGNYGPGLNIHRSVFAGRNFEYYSEDPVLSGMLCSWQITGCKQQGTYCFIKHIALNDSDGGRNGRYVFATEQAFRQIYAKPFEIVARGADICDKNGGLINAEKANAYMASVDRIGTTRVTGSYNFLTQMVRNEWGFRGTIVTDYYQAGHVNDVDEGIRCGNDLMLNGAGNCQWDDTSTNTFKYYVRQACKNILYTYVDTKF